MNTNAARTRASWGRGARRGLLALVVVLASGPLASGARGGAADGQLSSGIGFVGTRVKQHVSVSIDKHIALSPRQLEGRTLIIRRLADELYLPQSSHPFARQWRESGTAQVLPTKRTGGALKALVLWEDKAHPVAPGDRISLCAVPAEGSRPAVLGIACLSAPADSKEEPRVGPGQEVWLKADVVLPLGEPHECTWKADVGAFVYAGGESAGQTLKGPTLVRWRAPAELKADGTAHETATITFRVFGAWHAKSIERTLTIGFRRAEGAYKRVATIAARVPEKKGGSLGPLFSDASLVAAAPGGGFYLVDAPKRRLLHWSQAGPHYLPLGKSPVVALESLGGEARLIQDGTLYSWRPGAEKPTKRAALPKMSRCAGLRLDAAGSALLLDTGAPPCIHAAGVGAEPWRQSPLEPRVDSPFLTGFTLDPLSSDVYVFDSRDRLIRLLRAFEAGTYIRVKAALSVDKAVGQAGLPVAMLPRPGDRPPCGVPIQLVFAKGSVSQEWSYEGEPPAWRPSVSSPPRELTRLHVVVRSAARLPDGDLVVGGEGKVDDEPYPVVAQLSPDGQFRRMLPVPAMAPRLVAVAPGGQRYALLVRERWGTDEQRLVLLGPDGWVVRDLGSVASIEDITRLRPDRTSADYVFAVGERRGRISALRINARDPKRYLELSYAGIPGARVPEHEAADVACSPQHMVVLDRGGKVLVFANGKPIKYAGAFETELRKPQAIALFSEFDKRPGPGGDPQSYVCVLPSGKRAAAIHIWRFRLAADGKPVVVKVGIYPDPERTAETSRLSYPVTMDSGWPDRPELLYVLDREGSQVHLYDLRAIVAKLSARGAPDAPGAPVIAKVGIEDGAADMAIGPGQAIHLVDTEHAAIHTHARRP